MHKNNLNVILSRVLQCDVNDAIYTQLSRSTIIVNERDSLSAKIRLRCPTFSKHTISIICVTRKIKKRQKQMKSCDNLVYHFLNSFTKSFVPIINMYIVFIFVSYFICISSMANTKGFKRIHITSHTINFFHYVAQ